MSSQCTWCARAITSGLACSFFLLLSSATHAESASKELQVPQQIYAERATVDKVRERNQSLPRIAPELFARSEQIYDKLVVASGVTYVDPIIPENALKRIRQIYQGFPGQLSTAFFTNEGLVFLKDNSTYPLMSLMKFHVAYAVAVKMFEQEDDLDKLVSVPMTYFRPLVHSPLYREVVLPLVDKLAIEEGLVEHTPDYEQWMYKLNVQLNLRDLIYYSTAQSDTNSTDILLNMYLQGPEDLNNFVKSRGLKHTQIKWSERDMAEDDKRIYDNYSTAYEVGKIYHLFMHEPKIKPRVRNIINKSMAFTQSGLNRIQKAISRSVRNSPMLNPTGGYIVFDRSGYGPMNSKGNMRIAANSLGYIKLDDKMFIVVTLAKNIYGQSRESIHVSETATSSLAYTLLNIFTFNGRQPARSINR